MRKSIIFITLGLLSLHSSGQFVRADYKKALELEHRPLIVMLFDLAKDARTQCDSTHMAFYNETMREILPEYWTLSDSIIFMKSSRVERIIESKSKEYVIFSSGYAREGQQSSGDVFWYPSFTFMLFLSEDGMRFDGSMIDRGNFRSPYIADQEMTGQLFRGKYIFKLSFFNYALSENDILLVMKQFTANIEEALKQKYPKGGIYAGKMDKDMVASLKNYTLLVPSGIYEEGISRKKIESFYDHPFRIAGEEEIRQFISLNTEGMAYIHYLWSDHMRMFQAFIIDAGSKDIIAVFRPGKVSIGNDCMPAGKSYRAHIEMHPKHLKRLR